jgi:hypothetical protein
LKDPITPIAKQSNKRFGLCSTLIIAIATTAFFFSTWETYYTGTLYLGYINGPTEGLLVAIASMIVAGVYGTTS